MVDSNQDYLEQRRQELVLGRGDALTKIQGVLEDLYPAQARALSLNRQILRIITPNASVASELRLRQVELAVRFRQESGEEITKMAISIRGL